MPIIQRPFTAVVLLHRIIQTFVLKRLNITQISLLTCKHGAVHFTPKFVRIYITF